MKYVGMYNRVSYQFPSIELAVLHNESVDEVCMVEKLIPGILVDGVVIWRGHHQGVEVADKLPSFPVIDGDDVSDIPHSERIG